MFNTGICKQSLKIVLCEYKCRGNSHRYKSKDQEEMIIIRCIQRHIPEDYDSHDPQKGTLNQDSGEKGAYWCRRLAMGVRQPVMNRGKTRLCPIPYQDKNKGQLQGFRIHFMCYFPELCPFQRADNAKS